MRGGFFFPKRMVSVTARSGVTNYANSRRHGEKAMARLLQLYRSRDASTRQRPGEKRKSLRESINSICGLLT